MTRGRVVLAMSGGVDSSVCAHLLIEQGYEVIGFFMRTGASAPPTRATETPHRHRGCCSAVDAADARHVAERLNIPFYALNFADDFGRIKDYFADEYFRGRTPNPCVVCNTWLKFGKLWDYARTVGADGIATGHYARIVAGPDGPWLCKGSDGEKDQSYFLHGLDRSLLGKIRFPVGEMPKAEVRRLAEREQLGVHHKPDSQEVCFVPSGDYRQFLRQHRPEQLEPAGNIVEIGGRVVGAHAGISQFTVGQRRGLGVALGEPRYVLQVVPQTREVLIGPKELLMQSALQVDQINWLTAAPPRQPIRAQVKIRYLHAAANAVISPLQDQMATVVFDEPQSAITPGQAAVFYDQDRVLGGGWIHSTQSAIGGAAP